MSTNDSPAPVGTPAPNRGWAVLGVSFLAQMLAIGTVSYGFGLVAKPLAAEFGLSRADANLGLILLLVGMATASVGIGRALDRLPGRRIIVGGALLFGLGCAGVAASSSLWGVALSAFFLLASGTAALGPMTAATLTSRWFDQGRGRALGIVSVATSVGGIVTLPLLALLLEAYGWRAAIAAAGAAVVVLVGTLGWLLVREPAPRAPPSPLEGVPLMPLMRRWTTGQLLRTRDFWLLALAVGLVTGIDQALLATLIPYGTDQGFTVAAATLLVSAVSGSAIIGKLVVGVLSDRIDLRWLMLAVVALTEVFLLVLVLDPGYTLLLVACVFAGAAIGGISPLWAAFVGQRFGLLSYGMVMGLMIPLQMPLALLALRYIGQVYDSAGRYTPAFVAFALLVPLAALAILPVAPATGHPNK